MREKAPAGLALGTAILMWGLGAGGYALADGKEDQISTGYSADTFFEQSAAIPWHLAGIFGGALVVGIFDWDWGSSSFKTNSEGFFGEDTHNGGMDKLGHAWSAALLSDAFAEAIRDNAADPWNAEYTGFLLSMGVMATIEVFDGFSTGYGFSWQDMVANSAGAAFGLLKTSIPGFREKFDFRMEYIPSGNVDGFRPHSDYSGQKYLLALKLSGFEGIEDTPLRFVDLHAGYFARGFTAGGMARRRGEAPRALCRDRRQSVGTPAFGRGQPLQGARPPHPRVCAGALHLRGDRAGLKTAAIFRMHGNFREPFER